jgi:hypothetical protein
MKTLPLHVAALILCTPAYGAEDVEANRDQTLKATIDSFQMELAYEGEQGKPFYCLRLAVPVAATGQDNSFCRCIQISEAHAHRIRDHLKEDGFLSSAREGDLPAGSAPKSRYVLRVQSEKLQLVEDLGWNLAMLRRLDGLRTVLEGDAASAMDLLLGRLSGVRRVMEKAADASVSFEVTARRDDSQVRFVTEGTTTVIHVDSEFGIDRATVRRKGEQWPGPMVVRLHLKGLESFQVGNGVESIHAWVSSTGSHDSHIALKKGGSELSLGRGTPHWTEVRIIGSLKAIPLKQGYFEITLPQALFKDNPREITLAWIDFYRG